MDIFKKKFNFSFYKSNNNIFENLINEDVALMHYLYLGIYDNLQCNEDMSFIDNILPVIKFLKSDNVKNIYSLETKKNIILSMISNKNNFNFSKDFFSKANNINGDEKYYINYGHEKGLIFSEKQILIYYPTAKIIKTNNSVLVNYNSKSLLLNDFCSKYLYQKDVNFFLNNFKIYDNKLLSAKLAVIIHVGNIDTGIEIIRKLKNYLNLNFSLIVNINEDLINKKNYNILLNLIKEYDNYLVTFTPNFGNDISPFLINYYYLLNNNYKYEFMFKIHTKTSNFWRIKLLDCFFDKDINKLLEHFNDNNIGMLGSDYFLLNNDDNNKKILNELYPNCKDYQFIAGTIFITKFNEFNDIFKNKYIKPLFLFPFYSNNFLFKENSIPHSFERIFGFELYKKEKYIYGINKFCNNLFIIFHVGNISIFDKIINRYTYILNAEKIIITINNKKFKNHIQDKIKKAIIIFINNKGMDIGGFLKGIEYIFKNKLNHKKYTYLKIHTKSNDEWRNNLLDNIFNNIDLITKFQRNSPFIFGSSNCIIKNTKLVNRNYIKDIILRNNYNLYEFEKFMDLYYNYSIWESIENSNDLFLNNKFYAKYENIQLLDADIHWNNCGINEFHRINNPCRIKKFGITSYLIAGTVFAFNNKYLDILSKINFGYEYNILEEKYIVNDISRKTHAWEYFFSILPYVNKSYIISVSDNNITKLKPSDDNLNIQAIINIPYSSSKIAFFLLVPENNVKYSGGYKTLLRYISYLNNIGVTVDIYFGDRIEHIDTDCNGYNILSHVNLKTCIKNLEECNEFDVKQNNFYLGLKCQKKYELVVANAWQTAEPAIFNSNNCNKLVYIIQDLEYLFYPYDLNLQMKVKNTYINEFNYYCLSNYLYQNFNTKFTNVTNSVLGYDNNIYYDMNKKRNNSVLITYYDNKPGRMPELIIEITKKLVANKIKCSVFPKMFELDSEYVEFLGQIDITQLNNEYKKHKVAIVFSNSNPSRLGYEMYGAGLKVIEYDSECTKYDMPSEHFTKVNSSNDIENIVLNLMNSEEKNSEDFKLKISKDVEKDIVLSFFENLLYP